MAQDKEEAKKQSGGINIESSDVTIGEDAVGRDKVEQQYQYYGEESFQDWEAFYAGGCLVKTMIVVGAIVMIGGMLGFMGAVLLGLTAGGFQEVNSVVPLAVVGAGAGLVGMLTFAAGRILGRRSAYQQRRDARQRGPER